MVVVVVVVAVVVVEVVALVVYAGNHPLSTGMTAGAARLRLNRLDPSSFQLILSGSNEYTSSCHTFCFPWPPMMAKVF